MTDLVLWETDDALSEPHLAENLGHHNLSDYAEGFGFTPADTDGNGQYDETDIAPGKAYIKYTDADGLTQQKMGKRDTTTTLSLTEGSVNYIYFSIDNSDGANDSIVFTAKTSQSEPSDPFGDGRAAISLYLGSIDATGNSASGTRVNTDPDIEAESLFLSTNDRYLTGVNTSGVEGKLLGLTQYDNVQIGDPNGNTAWMRFLTSGTEAGYIDHNQNWIHNTNDITEVGALKFGSSDDRVIYRGGSGIFNVRAYGEAASIINLWAPPEPQGGKESTLALVVGDNNDYVYDLYNNSGYTTGTRDAQFGVSFKHQDDATSKPFVFDYDNSALGGSSYVERMKIIPQGEFQVLNSDLRVSDGDAMLSSTGELQWPDQGGGQKPGIYVDANGEVIARDDAGNTSQLT